ncbi:Gfo/Idh/MocA family protein [Pseudorhizobium flavum]|uniref:Putative dehydrogenase n=1 Tax=Pseudorhizobium flavum TaxID=1335061 RepID=A0A7W9YXN0_9HYPH|nr:Gfo/Idh/MocA family oxidoreductase [Pseudorhizobium flavum]MBB6180295.1 putative dehydrogenase [Pseudorhizobium flavum]CAD6618121.1 gfo/Idh/MocA family oxidoreductase [Pseudorhizobium flavum]
MKLLYGVIGCGMMGQEHLRNIALLPDADVIAIFEPDATMRQRAAAIAPQAVFVASVPELLQINAINCLLIASPNHVHLDQLEEVASIRPLPVLVEKPLFTSMDELPRLEALRSRYPAPIWVAMEYRYMPPVARLISEAEEATGGIRMLTIREHRFPFLQKVGNWNRFNDQTGGTLVEKCCHFFDLMRHILKSDPIRITASGGQAVNHLDEVHDGRRSDVWDHAYVLVDFDSGARAMLELCMFAEGARYQEEISAIGPRGKIECKVPGPGRFWPQHLGAPPIAQVIISPRDPKGPRKLEIPVDPLLLEAGDHNGSTFYQHQRFQRAVAGQAPVEVTLDDGLWAAFMGQTAQEAAASNRVIEVPPIRQAERITA